jgi:hypothetical protein
MRPAICPPHRDSHGDEGFLGGTVGLAGDRRGKAILAGRGNGLRLLGVLLLAEPGEHLQAPDDHLRLPVADATVVVPLPGLETPFDVDQLALREELPADLRQPVPRDQVVILGPLRRPVATELVGSDHEIRQGGSLH